jgi:hypothetical protein
MFDRGAPGALIVAISAVFSDNSEPLSFVAFSLNLFIHLKREVLDIASLSISCS